jgi:hypothetical protein
MDEALRLALRHSEMVGVAHAATGSSAVDKEESKYTSLTTAHNRSAFPPRATMAAQMGSMLPGVNMHNNLVRRKRG